jgi:hypothetical protein
MEQARKLKDLQKENAQLRRAVADLTVEKQILKTSPRETYKSRVARRRPIPIRNAANGQAISS